MALVPALYVEERFFTVTEDLKQSLVMSALTVKGLQCSCGNRGCLEMYASSYVVREKLKKITGLNLPYADYFKIHDRPEVEDILEE